MLPDGKHKRQFYLGIDFIRKGTRLPKLQIWQEQLLDAYPDLADAALESAGDLNLLPKGATSLRIHSVGGWGAITMGKNIAMTAFEMFGMNVKANPKYGSEKKGQPTTFYAVLAHEPVRLNAELKHVNVVLSPDPNVFRHSNPLAGMEEGGVFVIQSHEEPEAMWRSLPAEARQYVRDKKIEIYCLDAFGIASDEASDAELRYRMQGVAFMGAFFKCAPLAKSEGMDEAGVFAGIEAQIKAKFGKLGQRIVDDNMRVIRRGFDEVRKVPTDAEVGADEAKAAPGSYIPSLLNTPDAEEGPGQPGPLLRAGVRGVRHRAGRHQRSVRGHLRHPGGDEHRAGHDQHPLRGPRLHRGEVHRVQPVLGAVPRRGDPRPGGLRRGPAGHGHPHHGQRQARTTG